ncbi:MAG: 3'-5' exonuclease, partial [Dehalococcoidia bacterium]|nr:3'-5' exonuclease [Dehalococcoidia bacterium]
FIVGAEDGVLPHFRSFRDPNQMEEERRLCYVGVTRARHRLYLLRADHRSLAGMSYSNLPFIVGAPASTSNTGFTTFLNDVPRHLLGAPVPVDEAVRGNTSPTPPVQLVQLKRGERVSHTVFGLGVVVSMSPVPGDQEVTVDFKDRGLKKLLLSLAPLSRVEDID